MLDQVKEENDEDEGEKEKNKGCCTKSYIISKDSKLKLYWNTFIHVLLLSSYFALPW
jgi:hypothetical protein